MTRFKMLRTAYKISTTLAMGAVPWLRNPWKPSFSMTPELWKLLRDNPAMKFSIDGNMRLVPR